MQPIAFLLSVPVSFSRSARSLFRRLLRGTPASSNRRRSPKKILAAIGIVAICAPLGLSAQERATKNATDLRWLAGPPTLPPGAQVTVLLGDPGKEGPYVIRLKFPARYKIPAHTHPNNDENVTVISGAFHFGLGAKLDEAEGTILKAGGFAHAAKGIQHYAWASEETIIQIHGQGPQGISYMNPADDPRKK